MVEAPFARPRRGQAVAGQPRIVPLGAFKAGKHEFVIDVPDAMFAGGQGDFPFSLYIQAE